MKEKIEWSRWLVPALVLGIGGAYLVLSWLGGDPERGVWMLAIMVAYGGLLLLGGRSELVRQLRGQPADERYEGFGVLAVAFMGFVTVLVVLGLFLWELGRGEDGQPYALICLVSGASYLAALLWLRWRS